MDVVITTRSSSSRRLPPCHAGVEPTDTALGPAERERLLVGEDGSTCKVADAIHWAKVYADLFAYKDEMRVVTENRVASMSLAARRELERTDVRLFRGEAQRLERRLQFWRRRSVDLSARVETAHRVRAIDPHSS